MVAFSSRFGSLSERLGPRLFMGLGPIVAGAGLLLYLLLDEDGDYLTGVLPASVVFGLGLAMTVAPLTATVLGAIDEEHAGIASGVNNAIARIAGLLAIAVIGLVVAAQYGGSLDEAVGDSPPPAVARAVERAKETPLVPEDSGRLRAAEVEASVSAFHTGTLVGALLVIAGGVLSLVGIVNPRRISEAAPEPLPEVGSGILHGPCPPGCESRRVPTSSSVPLPSSR